MDNIKSIPERDTITVYITDIKTFAEDSTLYVFSEDFVRYWGSKILKVKDGYKRYIGEYGGSPFLLKFPINVGNTWQNKFPLVTENCAITAVDTTLNVDDQVFENCIEKPLNRVWKE